MSALQRGHSIAFCWASGRIEFGTSIPEGALEIARGASKRLAEAISVVARHGYEEGVLLVPGVPEAEGEPAKLAALQAWLLWCSGASRGIKFAAFFNAKKFGG